MMNFTVSPYFIITSDAEKFRRQLEDIFKAETLYIQRIKDRPQAALKNIATSNMEKIDQCVMKVGDIKLMLADDTEGLPIELGNNVSLCITYDQVEATQSAYEQLVKRGAEILKAFSPEFYSEGYGYVKDEFGVAYHLFTKRKEA